MHDEIQHSAIALRERLNLLDEWPIVKGREFVVPHELLTRELWDAIIVVAGGRNYNRYEDFVHWLELRLMKEDLVDLPRIVFVSGKASKGADDMIIRWCKENGFPWAEFPADWDGLGRSAGYVRNAQMARVATHLITFWDGESRGTKHMIDQGKKYGLVMTINLVEPDEDWLERIRKTSWQETEQLLKQLSTNGSRS